MSRSRSGASQPTGCEQLAHPITPVAHRQPERAIRQPSHPLPSGNRREPIGHGCPLANGSLSPVFQGHFVMPRAVVYLRVSTQEQAETGAGLKAQEDACRAHAARADLEVVGPFADEGISGAATLDERPGLIESLAMIGSSDILVVAKRDRLGRDPIVVNLIEAAVRRQGGRVVSAAGEGTDDDTPTSILMRRIIDAFAKYERLLIKARTRAALLAKRRRGQRVGSVPFGFDLLDDGQRSKKGRPVALVPNLAEQATMNLVGDLHLGGMPLRKIARELDRRGILPKKGGSHWSPGSIARILQRTPNTTHPGVTADACPTP